MAFINSFNLKIQIFPFYEPDHYIFIDHGNIRGVPLYWKNDLVGNLSLAVRAFFDQTADPDQIQVIIKYLQYHISAPCWLETRPRWLMSIETIQNIEQLRDLSQQLKTRADIDQYLQEALKFGIDPL